MSTVLITGGSGTLGVPLLRLLRERGHHVRVLSRRPDAGTHLGDLKSGDGVRAAAGGAELIVHAASDTRRLGRTDLQQTQPLLQAASDASHLLYVSIVGIDAIPFSYYRRKLACEQQIAASGIPHTILRATQFHELIAKMLHTVERLPVAPLPLDFRFQAVAAADVAHRIVELVASGPTTSAPDFGGPEVLTLGEMATIWKRKHRRPHVAVRLPVLGRVAKAFRSGQNTCPEHADGNQTWSHFVDT